MQEKDFSRLMSIGLGLNVAARRASGKIKKDEELAKFLDMFSYSKYIFLEIDVSFFYYALANQIKIEKPLKEVVAIARELKDFRTSDISAFNKFDEGLKLLRIAIYRQNIPFVIKKIERAIELSPYEPRYRIELSKIYEAMGRYGKSKKITEGYHKKVRQLEETQFSKQAYSGLQKTFHAKKKHINFIVQRKGYRKFLDKQEFIFSFLRKLTKELSKYYKGEDANITSKMIPGMVDDCLKCLEWIAILADLTFFKVKFNYGDDKFIPEIINALLDLLGFEPEDLTEHQTPNFLSPDCRKKAWMNTLGFDILSFSPIESVKDAVYVRIDNDVENDDPKKHVWYSKESKTGIDIAKVHTEHKGIEIDQISEHIERHFGEPLTIIHDKGHHPIHIDLYVIPPDKDRNFAMLITSGMSERPMNAPPDAWKWWRVDINSIPEDMRGTLSCKYAELVVKLPSDWPLPQPGGQLIEDEYLWPIEELHHLIRYVHGNNEWFWDGHTMRNRKEGTLPFHENTKLAGWVFLYPPHLPQSFGMLKINNSKAICFLQIVPAYLEEITFAMDHGTENLIKRFREFNIPDFIDINRKNSCV